MENFANAVQNEFLSDKRGKRIRVFMRNESQLLGELIEHDDSVIVIRNGEGRKKMIYKSAISTISEE